jgi:hypothetical protein
LDSEKGVLIEAQTIATDVAAYVAFRCGVSSTIADTSKGLQKRVIFEKRLNASLRIDIT